MLAELLAGAPGTQLLVTSRAPLDLPEERIYPVPPLQLADATRPVQLARLRETEAIRLFVDRAREARADFELSDENAEAVAELCLRLDGLPLALELAAARIKLLSPRAILERLGGRLELLKAVPGAGLPERHRTLRAAVDWSYDLLTADEQALFTSLGVFVGGFSLDGAAAVAGDLELDVVDGIESLLNNSLLRTERMSEGEPRFGMLETMREYALERLAERGDGEAVRRRHAASTSGLPRRPSPRCSAPSRCDGRGGSTASADNFRAALTWAAESGETEVGLRTAGALWRFWQMRAADVEGREHLDRLLAGGSGSPSIRAFAQSRAASLAYYQGDFEAVHRYLEASLPVFRELGDDSNLSGCLRVLAMTALAEGDADEARALAEEALELARRARNPTSEAYALANLGVVLGVQGEFDDAQRVLEESIRRARELGNLRSVGSWTKGSGRDHLPARQLPAGSRAVRAKPRHPPQPRRRVGNPGLALGPCARGARRTRQRIGAAPAEREPRASAEERPPLSIGERPRDRRQARRRPEIAIAAPLACTGRQAFSRIDPRRDVRVRGLARPRPESPASAPCSASRRSPRHGRRARQ